MSCRQAAGVDGDVRAAAGDRALDGVLELAGGVPASGTEFQNFRVRLRALISLQIAGEPRMKNPRATRFSSARAVAASRGDDVEAVVEVFANCPVATCDRSRWCRDQRTSTLGAGPPPSNSCSADEQNLACVSGHVAIRRGTAAASPTARSGERMLVGAVKGTFSCTNSSDSRGFLQRRAVNLDEVRARDAFVVDGPGDHSLPCPSRRAPYVCCLALCGR